MLVYYRIYDTTGLVDVKEPLSALTIDKQIGRIDSSSVIPPFNTQSLKLSIAQHEGLQDIFKAAGAQLYTTWSQSEITDGNGLLKQAGRSLTSPVKLKFPVRLKKPQSDQIVSRFVGKWSCTATGSTSVHRFKNHSYFTLKAYGNTIAAVGSEQWTTTYTGFVCEQSRDKALKLPAPGKYTNELSDFKLVDNSHISFLRSNTQSSWRMSGALSADGRSLTLTANPNSGKAGQLQPRVLQRVG